MNILEGRTLTVISWLDEGTERMERKHGDRRN